MRPYSFRFRGVRLFASILLMAMAAVAQGQSPGPAGAGALGCGPPPTGALCPPAAWMRFARMDVKLTLGAYTSDYIVMLTDVRDIYASYFERTEDEKVRGEALLLADRLLAVKADHDGAISDERTIDVPLSVAELATVLLGAAIPDGPAAIAGTRTIKAGERKRYILAPTATSPALYGPPWQMTGSVRKTSDTAIAFTMRFTFRQVDKDGRMQKGAPLRIELSGTADYPAQRPELPDSFNLSGWTFTTPGTEQETAKNLGEARKQFGLR